jgi:HK97 family phage portal protein
MSFLDHAVRGARIERRDTLARPTQWLVDALAGSSATYTGRAVSPTNSLELIPVYSAVQLLASAVGQLPLIVYQRLPDGGKERAQQHRAWGFLHDAANPEMAADEFWALVTMHLLTWGNHFSIKLRDNPLQLVDGFWPLHPSRISVNRDNDGNKYFVLDGKREEALSELDILHIKGPSWDGTVGWSPVQMARQGLSGMMEQEEFSTRFWANGAIPPVVLTHPNKLGREAIGNVKSSWKLLHGGVVRSGDPAVLEEGMKAETIALPHEDAQFIETQKWNDVRVAQLFGLPAWMLNASAGNSMTYTSTEMEGMHFVRYSLGRWLSRIEQSLTRDPSIFVQGTRFFAEFLVDAFLRASTKERYEAYQIGIASGFLDIDEVRNLENLPPKSVDALPPEPPAASNGHGDPQNVPAPVTGA